MLRRRTAAKTTSRRRTTMPPLKPEVAVIDGKVWHFVGSAYVQYTAGQTKEVIRKLQSAHAQLLKDQKRAKRKARAA